MPTSELVIFPERNSPVAMALTPSALSILRSLGITSVTPDLESMARIAYDIGDIDKAQSRLLGPQFIVVRHGLFGADSSDPILPMYDGRSDSNKYHPATSLDKPVYPILSRLDLVRAARSIGAPVLTEIKLAGYPGGYPDGSSAQSYAAGRLTGQRPCIPPRRPVWSALLADKLLSFRSKRKAEEVGRRQGELGEPLVFLS